MQDQTKVEQLMREELAVLKKAKDDLQVRNEHQDAEINDLQVCLLVAFRNKCYMCDFLEALLYGIFIVC